MKRVLWKMLSILAVFGLALVTAGCPTEPETQTNGPAAIAFELVTVTVTGIPAGYQNQSAGLTLRHLTSGGWATGDWVNQVEGTSATFSFAAFPGTYSVGLWFGFSDYLISSRNITAGNQTIPFSAFTPLEQVSITVTGIPDRYIGSGGNQIRGRMCIMRPGTFARQGSWISTISGASATFTPSIVPGSYDVHLRFLDHNIIRYYSAPLRNIAAGTNTISFSYFAVVEPITVTLTGIPNRYINDANVDMDMVLNTPGLIDWVADDWVEPESSSAAFTFFTLPGTYAVALYIDIEDDWGFGIYSALARSITAGTNTIPFSDFTAVPSMSITVTGIPSEYVGGSKRIDLTFPNTSDRVAQGRTHPITSASATIDFFLRFDDWVFNSAGTYGVYLALEHEDGWGEYFIPSRHLNAGSNTIPFSEFTPVAPDASGSIYGFTENVIPTGSHERPPVGRFR